MTESLQSGPSGDGDPHGGTGPRDGAGSCEAAAANDMTDLICATDVGFSYRRGGRALQNVSFRLRPGRSLGIVGESGAGKTTLLRLLLGLDLPNEGTLVADGSELTRGGARMRAHRRFVQPVFQDPYSSLDPRQSIGGIIAEPLRSLGIARGTEVRTLVTRALASVGLPADAATRYPHQFSGGQRQRIAIARAIVANPRVLLADEPVSALDMSTRLRVIRLLEKLARADAGPTLPTPVTMVLVSHDLSIVARLCDDILVLERGRVVEQGETRRVLASPEHPYTRRLLDSVPRLSVAPAVD